MEKFVTDLDKLLDDFESTNGNIHVDLCNSSGYNSLKVNSELNVIELGIKYEPLSVPHHDCYLVNEPVIPTTAISYENSVEDINVSPSINAQENVTVNLVTSLERSNDIIGNSQSSVESLVNGTQHDKRRPSDLKQNMSNGTTVSLSPSPTQVPPRKKSRPNSLLGLSSVVSMEQFGGENTMVAHEENSMISSKEVPRHCRSPEIHRSNIKRPQSLNICERVTHSDETCHSVCTVPNIKNNDISLITDNVIPVISITTDPAENSEKTLDEISVWQGIPVEELGEREPTWIGDDTSEICLQCSLPFTIFRRRHHCRACGRLLCNKCCCWRMQLRFSSKLFPKDRVCAICFQYLVRVEAAKKQGQNIKSSNFQPLNSALKSNRPMSLSLTPNSLLSSQQSLSENIDATCSLKSVIFADGIRPGGDLTEVETSRIITPTKFQTRSHMKSFDIISQEVISREDSLIDFKSNFGSITLKKLTAVNVDSDCFFIDITKNLRIQLQIIKLPHCSCSVKDGVTARLGQKECDCDSVECWYFASLGMETIGAEEIIIILKRLPEEDNPPMEILNYYFQIYQKAFRNETKLDNMELTVEVFPENNNNTLKEWAGILHVRPSFQCLNKVPTPRSSFLIGILIHRWEFPWAMCLPLRLIMALGNQSRFYPCSIMSDRGRPPVYGEVCQTILQVVSPIFAFPNNLERGMCDNTIVPTVPGMWLHLLASQETIVQIPKNSYSHLLGILSFRQSEYSALALAASFSREADSHLVCCQNEESGQYYSSAISIQNTERVVTAATFILFAPCKDSDEHGTTIVEDVIVVKLSQMHLGCIINSLKTMSDLALQCGSSESCSLTKDTSSCTALRKSIIKIVWTDSLQMSDMASIARPSFVTDETIQSVMNSLRDGGNKLMRSYRVPSSLQNVSLHKDNQNFPRCKLVWTRFHMVETGNTFSDASYDDPVDLEQIIRDIACYFANSIIQFLDMLYELELVNIGLRTKIGRDSIHWLMGGSKKTHYCSSPDQSPTFDTDFRYSYYYISRMKNHFHNVQCLPEVCSNYINKLLEPFLNSKRALLRNEYMISELEFHIIE